MKTEFYRPHTELLPTFSLVLAVSLAGLNTAAQNRAASSSTVADGASLPAKTSYMHAYYGPAQQAVEQGEQIEVLRRFADSLLGETQDTPPAVLEVLNRHFW